MVAIVKNEVIVASSSKAIFYVGWFWLGFQIYAYHFVPE